MLAERVPRGLQARAPAYWRMRVVGAEARLPRLMRDVAWDEVGERSEREGNGGAGCSHVRGRARGGAARPGTEGNEPRCAAIARRRRGPASEEWQVFPCNTITTRV
jgi:hypothetical protein